MRTLLMGFLTETNMHLGTEAVKGLVDLPVAREITTGYPVVPGSSFKGTLRDRARNEWPDSGVEIDRLFGKHNEAGAFSATDVRLLMLPVRTLSGHFRWVTCPYLLERFVRDMKLACIPSSLGSIKLTDSALGIKDEKLYLEEVSINVKAAPEAIKLIAETVKSLILHESVRNRLVDQLIVISDTKFRYFAEHGLQVRARNSLDNVTKSSNNLWYEESIPADSIFYGLLIARPAYHDSPEKIVELFCKHPYLQMGGNETIGHGWCAVVCITGGATQ